ncbi:MAG: hypothetical protein AB7S50_15505 [Bacteroidales bacterium]
MKIRLLIFSLIIPLELFSQRDSSTICNQYYQAIDYIRQDSFIRNTFQEKECKFKVSNEIKQGSLDYTFAGDLMSYILNKTSKLADDKVIDSIEKEMTNYKEAYSTKINCIDSDDKYNLTLNFERVNDTIFLASIHKIENKRLIRHTDNSEGKNQKTFLEYLFIINRKNTIEKVFKRKSYEIIQNTKGY